MELIKEIEISYFRSIYKQNIKKLKGINVFFGRNDSGKSNFLRALNLFFNDTTNPCRKFDFTTDFNHKRLVECTDNANTRKFVYIKVTFKTPSNWTKSLGKEFWVKKTWNISRDDVYVIDSSLTSNKKQFLTRFLNKIKFHYVPAIKDRSIFEDLLSQVYSVISQEQTFTDSLDGFVKELQEKTMLISDAVHSDLGIKSAIAPPEDLTDLFKSLDFEIKNSHNDNYSLTLQKGDGIQVRHIPVILGFLSDKGKEDYHIWGFEEPENSLELASAVEESKLFSEYAKSNNKQIFLTSHSPAFFLIDDEESNRYFVSKSVQNALREQSIAELIVKGREPSDLMDETPLLPVISHYLKKKSEEIEVLKDEVQKISKDIEEVNKPILYVEGESDKIVIEKAIEIFLDKKYDIKVASCSGTTKMQGLSKDGNIFGCLNPGAKIFVLVDNDQEGRDLAKFERKRLLKNGGGNWVQHGSNKTYWCLLPFSKDFDDSMHALNIKPDNKPFVLENCFSLDIHKEAIKDKSLKFKQEPHSEVTNGQYNVKLNGSIINKDNTYILCPDDAYKIPFAEWVVNKADEDIEVLRIFEKILLDMANLIDS